MSEMNTNGYYESQDSNPFNNQPNHKNNKNKGIIAIVIAVLELFTY